MWSLTNYGSIQPFIKDKFLKAMKNVLGTRRKGNIGEDIACEFLIGKNFHISDRNYLKRWGELDVVAEKDGITHFFEIKSVTNNFGDKLHDTHRAEDNVDGWKMRKLRRIIETYLSEKGNHGLETAFKFHVLCVYMSMSSRTARVKWLKDIII